MARSKENAPATVGVYCTVKVVLPPPAATLLLPGAEMLATTTLLAAELVAVLSDSTSVPEFVTV